MTQQPKGEIYMNKNVLTDNENGTIIRYDKIPHSMFNFYALHRRNYKNGTALWHLCVEIAAAPAGKNSPDCIGKESNYIKMESFRGTKEQAIKRLDTIVKEYK